MVHDKSIKNRRNEKKKKECKNPKKKDEKNNRIDIVNEMTRICRCNQRI